MNVFPQESYIDSDNDCENNKTQADMATRISGKWDKKTDKRDDK